VYAVRKWKYYLDNGQPHTFFCDNDSLCKILTQKTQLDKFQIKVIHEIDNLNVTLVHVPTTEQKSDAITRQDDINVVETSTDDSVLPPPFTRLKKTKDFKTKAEMWQNAYDQDPDMSPIINMFKGKCVANMDRPWIKQNYKYESSLLYRKKQNCWVLQVPHDLRVGLLQAAHDMSGHHGFDKTLFNLQNYDWPSKRQDTRYFVQSCATCQCSKHVLHKQYGMPDPLLHPSRPRERIHIDTVTGVPTVDGYDEILTCIDAYSRYAIAIPVSKNIDSAEFLRVFTTHIVPHFGMVPTIITDKAKLFTSEYTRFSIAALGSTLQTSTAYHPEGNGTIERYHLDLNSMLRAMCLSTGKDWLSQLGLAVALHNNAVHSATGLRPTQLHFNSIEPVHTFQSKYEAEVLPIVQDKQVKMSTTKFYEAYGKLQQTIDRYNDKIQKVLTKRRHAKQPYFNVGELVWLRTVDFGERQFNRLQPTKWGPFPILEKLGSNTYLLQLPANCGVDPEVNVKRLEKYYTHSELRSAPFNVLSQPVTFTDEGKPCRIYADDVTEPKTSQFKIFGKHITHITGHTQNNLKNSPPSKSFQCSLALDTANPQTQSLEKIPFDHLVKNNTIHSELWKYLMSKGPTALPSNQKCVQLHVNWLHPILKQELKKKNQQ